MCTVRWGLPRQQLSAAECRMLPSEGAWARAPWSPTGSLPSASCGHLTWQGDRGHFAPVVTWGCGRGFHRPVAVQLSQWLWGPGAFVQLFNQRPGAQGGSRAFGLLPLGAVREHVGEGRVRRPGRSPGRGEYPAECVPGGVSLCGCVLLGVTVVTRTAEDCDLWGARGLKGTGWHVKALPGRDTPGAISHLLKPLDPAL